MARPIRRWLTSALALWLIVAPAGMALGCWYACKLQEPPCCRSVPAADWLTAPDSDTCPNCAICHPQAPQLGDPPKKPMPFVPLMATLTGEGTAPMPVGQASPIWTEPILAAHLHPLTPESPRAPPDASRS